MPTAEAYDIWKREQDRQDDSKSAFAISSCAVRLAVMLLALAVWCWVGKLFRRGRNNGAELDGPCP